MTLHRENTEIFDQKHQMYAEGADDDEMEEIDIVDHLKEEGWRCVNISTWYDKMQGMWKWSADISPIKSGVKLIAEERQRQIEVEGYDKAHDQKYSTDKNLRSDSLVVAAVCYASPSHLRVNSHPCEETTTQGKPPLIWPWDSNYWKPTPDNRIKELVKAGALIAAEIDRLQSL